MRLRIADCGLRIRCRALNSQSAIRNPQLPFSPSPPPPHTPTCSAFGACSRLLNLASIAITALVGCSGGGRVEMVPFSRADLPANEPLTQSLAIDEAFYSQGDGTLEIGLARRVDSPLGEAFDSRWELSIVLEGPPAGRERLYPLKSDSVRLVRSAGGNHRRGKALPGQSIVVLEAPKNGRLRGRFHLVVLEQAWGVLTGWSQQSWAALVVVGEFEAVRQAKGAYAIRLSTEADGFERAPPATRPAETQSGFEH